MRHVGHEVRFVYLEEFPGYFVNVEGVVVSDKTGAPLNPAVNQQGISSVSLYIEGKAHRRSVALLVAKAFLPVPEHEHFDTPTHKDGDKTNVHADNLMWRPRWFAIQYHQQFDPEGIRAAWNNYPIFVVEPEENFPRALDCAMKYGVLVRDLVLGAQNRRAVTFLPYTVQMGHK